MNWQVKGAIQRVLDTIPFGLTINDTLQQTVGILRNFSGNVAGKVKDALHTMSYLESVSVRPRGLSVMEVGSGWYPTLPVCFHLGGAASVYTFDIVRHMNEKLTLRMIECLDAHVPAIAAACGRPLEEVRADYARLRQCKTLAEALQTARIEYRAPGDACETGLPSGSLDLVYSNSVLEHVPGPVIAKMMVESRRVLRPGGLVLHNVACNDHYAHLDRSISFINFLQFPEAEWRRWNVSINYQNRLRASDFLSFAEQAGFEIVQAKKTIRPGTREALAKLRVAPDFQHYSEEDLLTTSVDFIGRSPAA